MKRLALALLLVLCPALPAAAKDKAKALAFTHVTVIDTAGGPSRADQTVVIAGARIVAVGAGKEVKVPEGAEVIDATGKFLIPGLWDMHVHITGVYSLKLFVANGVTGVRDMHAFYPPLLFAMRKAVRSGRQLGPRIVAAGALIDGPKPVWPGSLKAANAEEGRAAVRQLKKQGADFIKVYSGLPRDAFFAIAAEAKKQGLSFAGHVPESVSAAEASDAGQKSMEHLYGVWVACSAKEKELRKEAVDTLTRAGSPGLLGAVVRAQARAIDSQDASKTAALFTRFAKNGTWQCPTFTVLRALAFLDQEKFRADPRVKYMGPEIRPMWAPKGERTRRIREHSADLKRVYRKSLPLVRAMHRAKVPLLAGSDTPNPYCFPGFSLHDELALLVEAGLTPRQALQTATLNPARFLGRQKDLGTVAKGKLADLVLLSADPLADIKNTQKIAAVVVNGKLLKRADLDKLLAAVEAEHKDEPAAKP
jgi:imidazolonepropionase-like amidohydrolase